jgi:hypothetical protein
VLTESQQKLVREICAKNNLGTVQFQDTGAIHFKSPEPIKEKVLKLFTYPEYRFIDAAPTSWVERPDDMKREYWVTMMAEATD